MMTKRKSQRIGKKERQVSKLKMKGSLSTTSHLQLQLGQVSLFPLRNPSSAAPSRFQNLLDAEAHDPNPPASSSHVTVNDDAVDASMDDRDFILSQDFFW